MFVSINPYTQKVIATYTEHTQEETTAIINQSHEGFLFWKKQTYSQRSIVIQDVISLLKLNKEVYAKTITEEVGKPIIESLAEIEKCVFLCEHYLEATPNYLQAINVKTSGFNNHIVYEPLGVIFGIMPWNFPFWQVFRYAIPALMAGNTVLLKHAPNVVGTAELIRVLFQSAGENNLLGLLKIQEKEVESVIANPIVKAITFTGSEKGGKAVAQLACKYIKKCVLELGGSNAFIVLDDADLEKAIHIGVKSRLQNTGQSCIAAKRFIIHEKIAKQFITGLAQNFETITLKNPLDLDAPIGVIARPDLALILENQVQLALKEGAKLIIGGKRQDNWYSPTILTNINPSMTISQEEVFGPVALIFVVQSDDEAVALANNTSFGLGASVFTKDINRANFFISELEDGAVFINSMVVSDPRLPFGGTKNSGYGRELSFYGMHEFVNIKTVCIAE